MKTNTSPLARFTYLRELIERGAAELGAGVAWVPTGLGALALAHCEAGDGFKAPWQKVLDKLPLTAVTAVAAHQATLAGVGCRTLGDVRNQPRAAPGSPGQHRAAFEFP